MKKTRIKYKKLLIFLISVLCIVGGILLAVFVGFHWLRISSENAAGTSTQSEAQYYLFIGMNAETNIPQADSLLLISINQRQQLLYAISFPGNTKISRNDEPLLLLRDAFTDGSPEKTVSAVENILHIRVDRYAVFDNTSFSALIDHFNGVDLYVEKDMRHMDEAGNVDISLRQGIQTLNGQKSYEYLRYIDQEEEEIGRIQREERFFKALLLQNQKSLRLYSWGMAKQYWNALDTNISNIEAASLVYTVMGFPAENYHFAILPGEFRTYLEQKVWEINPIEIQKVIGPIVNQQGGQQ